MTTSPLVLGTMMFGTTVDEDTSFRLLDQFVDGGGMWLDTADCYSFWASTSGQGGDSERVLGRWLAARPGVRERVRIATKAGAEPLWPGSWPARREGLSPRAVRAAVTGSLGRLGIDSIDLLWLHQEDRTTPIEQTIDAVAAFVESGRVSRVGASNHPAWRVERARAHAVATGTAAIDAVQLSSSYLEPRPGARPPGNVHPFGVLSDEQRDHAVANGIEVWAYSPVLSGAYDNPTKPVPEVYDHPGTSRRLAALDDVARQLGLGRSEVVLAWLLDQGIRPILGGSRPEQLEAAMTGILLELSPEQRAHLAQAA